MDIFLSKQLPGHDLLIPKFFDTNTFLESLKYRPNPYDVFIATYPKCGTTWTQHLVQLVYSNGVPFTTGEDFYGKSPFLEMAGIEAITRRIKPGSIKTHLPFEMIPYSSKAKYICIVRNPKDTCVSFYHHHKNFPGYDFEDGSFDTFFEEFIRGRVEFGDYFEHLVSWYKHKNDPNVLFLTYESMKMEPEKSILKLAGFLGSEYEKKITDNPEVLKNILRYSNVDYMKEHTTSFVEQFFAKMDNDSNTPTAAKAAIISGLRSKTQDKPRNFNFVRKGQIGDWKSLFSTEQSRRLENMFDCKTNGIDGIADLWKDISWRG